MNIVRRVLASHRLLQAAMYTSVKGARFRGGRAKKRKLPISKVVHISPCYFSDRSYIGGGERYVSSLASAMAQQIETVLVSFGPRRASLRQGRLRIEVYPILRLLNNVSFDPLSYQFLRELSSADIIHCHQYWTAVTNLSIATGAALGKRIFVTDLGGAATHFTDRYPLAELVDSFLPISEFGAQMMPRSRPATVIYGGVDAMFLESESKADVMSTPPSVLFTGRLLPHKGINYLIEAMGPEVSLQINGRPYDSQYFQLLQQLARGKCVHFQTDASDEDLVKAYQNATVTVLPSVYKDVYGSEYAAPELLGLVMLESMACGTPVICTDVGAMPEFVEDGVTGFVVPPNDSEALKQKIDYLTSNPEIAVAMGARGRRQVMEKYSWMAVATRCLQAYRTPLGSL